MKISILSFILIGSFAKAATLPRPGAPVSSDATQADVLLQIDKGILDFNPSLKGPDWVIYPEDNPKIGVLPSDRQKKFDPKTAEQAEEDSEFGEDPDVDQILVK